MKKTLLLLIISVLFIGCTKDETDEKSVADTQWETVINQEHVKADGTKVPYKRTITLTFSGATRGNINFVPFDVPSGVVIEPIRMDFNYTFNAPTNSGSLTFIANSSGVSVPFTISGDKLTLTTAADPSNPSITTSMVLTKK